MNGRNRWLLATVAVFVAGLALLQVASPSDPLANVLAAGMPAALVLGVGLARTTEPRPRLVSWVHDVLLLAGVGFVLLFAFAEPGLVVDVTYVYAVVGGLLLSYDVTVRRMYPDEIPSLASSSRGSGE